MNGLDRALAMGERNGWTLKTSHPHVGYQRTVTWSRGEQTVTAYKAVNGAVTGGARNWGEVRILPRRGAADAVVSWLADSADAPEVTKPAETAPKPRVRSAQPNTPDRKIRRALEDLADTAGALQRTWERVSDFTEEDLAVLGQSLKALREQLGDVEVEAHSLRRQRRHEAQATAGANAR